MNGENWEDVPAERDEEMEAYEISPIALSFEAAAIIGMCATNIIGNSLICVLGYRRPGKSNFLNVLLLNVAVSDICVALITMPLMVASLLELKWKYGDLLCKISGVISLLFITLATLVLTVVLLQRWTAAMCPKEENKGSPSAGRKLSLLFIVVLFLAGTVVCLAFLIDWHILRLHPTHYLCRLANSPNYVAYRLFFCIFSLLVTLMIMILFLQPLSA